MATPATITYYTVSPHTGAAHSADLLCEKTWTVVVYYDSSGNPHLVSANYAVGIFNLYSDYVESAAHVTLATLPADVQAWLTQFCYDPSSFDVYA